MDMGIPLSLPREEPATSLKSRRAMRRERDAERWDPNAGLSTAAAQKPEILSRALCLTLTSMQISPFLEAIRVEIKGPVVVQEILIWFKRNSVAVVKIPVQKETNTPTAQAPRELLPSKEASSLRLSIHSITAIHAISVKCFQKHINPNSILFSFFMWNELKAWWLFSCAVQMIFNK